MTLQRKLVAVSCGLLALIGSVAIFLGSNGLSYEGRSVSQWLAWFDSPSGLSQEQWQERLQRRAEATYALRQMGPEVFPHLRRMLQPDSEIAKFRSQLSTERERVPAGSVAPPSPEEARMLRAVEACSALARDAQAMVPDLLLVLKSNSYLNVRSRAAYALGEIGGASDEVVPALLQSLSNRTDGNVLISLGKYGADAHTAVPTIVALLDGIETSVKEQKSADRNVLCEAVQALHQIAPQEAEKTLPLLREVLQEERDPFWRSRLSKLVNVISGASGQPSAMRTRRRSLVSVSAREARIDSMIKAAGHMRPDAHVEPLGNPCHGRLAAQPFGDVHLALVSFQSCSQILLRPVQARQLLLENAFGFVFFGFCDFGGPDGSGLSAARAVPSAPSSNAR